MRRRSFCSRCPRPSTGKQSYNFTINYVIIDSIKNEMEERGSSMTDGAPLVAIKKSLRRMKRESLNMDVMIGVLQHGMLQAGLKDRDSMQKISDDY